MARYLFASKLVVGKRILDVACGVGYGSDLLKAAGANNVVGVDYSEQAVRFAAQRHAKTRPDYLVADAESLPIGDGRFDVVVCFETIEHLSNPARFLKEVKGVLKAGGLFIVSTPNKGIYVDGNPFHTHEFTFDELDGVLRSSFQHVSTFAQDDWITSAIFNQSTMEEHDTQLKQGVEMHKAVSKTARETLYMVSLCSDAPLPHAPEQAVMTGFHDVKGYVLEIQQRDSRITLLDDQVQAADNALRTTTDALRTQISRRDAIIREGEASVAKRDRALEEANAQLAAIYGSLGYRSLEAYRRRMRWLFPPGSRRAFPYRALRKASGIVYRAPWRRLPGSLRRIRRLARRSREIIREEGWQAFQQRARRRLRGERVLVTAPIPIDYEEWIAANEPDARELLRQTNVALLLPYRPLISIITPIWNPMPEHLRQTIESVIGQTYDNWELCLVDGGSRGPGVRQVLEQFAASNEKIRVKFLEKNLGISGNSNAGLTLASGEFVAFLDHTDLLEPNALWEVASQLNRNPALDCIYSDEDFVSEDGARRFNPLFKPEWSPDIMLSANYLAHFRVLRRSLVDELSGERSEMDGAQDWDLLLRLSEKTERIAHVPRVLYHWRMDSTSAAGGIDNKPYALGAQLKAVQGHLDRCGMNGRVEQDAQGIMRVRWRVSGNTRVSIIIPTRHNRKLLESCLRGISRAGYRNWEIIVVETAGWNADRERWYEQAKGIAPMTVLWWDKPFNYSAVNNHGASASQGDALLFLNDDTEALSDDWLEELVGWLEQPGVGVVGAQLQSPDGSIQHGGDVIGLNGLADHLFAGANERSSTLLGFTGWYRNSIAVTGACLLIKRELFESIGRFDEDFLLCGSDVDLCLRARRAGLRTVITPFVRMIHYERATRGERDYSQDCHTSYWRYQSHLHGGDPYFSPNLSILSTVPQLRHPAEPTAVAAATPVLGRQVTPQRPNSARIEMEAASFAQSCQISSDEIEVTRRLHDLNSAPFDIKTINWFIPDFESPFYGGIHTILRFADHFKREFGVTNRFIVLGTGPEAYIRSGLRFAFPVLGDSEIRVCTLAEDELSSLPEADASVASLWVTAYAVSRFQRARRKFYQIQDFEPGFYPAGTLYALSEATYRMGLYGLVNTTTLKRIYESDYGGKAVDFTPCVDTSLFHRPEGPRHEDDTLTVFLYGRPSHWRNCYELAIAAIDRLKRRLKRKVRVVTAGSWSPSNDSESAYLVDSLGLLDYKETANLYRTCDVGLTLSVSKHPSYLPMELMASGALVVSNINPAGSWLLRDGENCLLAEPTAESLSAALERGLLDEELRQRLTAQALKDIQERHSDWASQMNKVYAYMCDPEAK